MTEQNSFFAPMPRHELHAEGVATEHVEVDSEPKMIRARSPPVEM